MTVSLLGQELNRWLTLEFEWGWSDCMIVLADWVLRVRGVDPAADLRRTYATPGECERVTRYFSDPLGVTSRAFEGVAGLAPTTAPQMGDVGVVLGRTERGIEAVGALCLGPGRGWVNKQPHGMQEFEPVQVLKAWSVGYDPAA